MADTDLIIELFLKNKELLKSRVNELSLENLQKAATARGRQDAYRTFDKQELLNWLFTDYETKPTSTQHRNLEEEEHEEGESRDVSRRKRVARAFEPSSSVGQTYKPSETKKPASIAQLPSNLTRSAKRLTSSSRESLRESVDQLPPVPQVLFKAKPKVKRKDVPVSSIKQIVAPPLVPPLDSSPARLTEGSNYARLTEAKRYTSSSSVSQATLPISKKRQHVESERSDTVPIEIQEMLEEEEEEPEEPEIKVQPIFRKPARSKITPLQSKVKPPSVIIPQERPLQTIVFQQPKRKLVQPSVDVEMEMLEPTASLSMFEPSVSLEPTASELEPLVTEKKIMEMESYLPYSRQQQQDSYITDVLLTNQSGPFNALDFAAVTFITNINALQSDNTRQKWLLETTQRINRLNNIIRQLEHMNKLNVQLQFILSFSLKLLQQLNKLGNMVQTANVKLVTALQNVLSRNPDLVKCINLLQQYYATYFKIIDVLYEGFGQKAVPLDVIANLNPQITALQLRLQQISQVYLQNKCAASIL